MKKRIAWFKDLTPEKILADGVSNAIWALALFLGLTILGLLKATRVPWGWTILTTIGAVGATCSWLLLRRRLRESPPGSVVARIHELATASRKIGTREDAHEWAHTVFDGLRGLGLQLPATEFEDLYSVIVRESTDNEKVFRYVRQGET